MSDDKRKTLAGYISHLLAIILTLGFFFIVLIALLGFVNISDPAITAFVGTALGYASAKLDPVLAKYFQQDIKEIRGENNNETKR